jgi:putative endonuclease
VTDSSSPSTHRPDRAAAGARAEALAAEHLRAHGLAIVARNYRTRFGEIDVIAREGAMLVFVEVRMRRSASFGGPLASITPAKRRRLVLAARGYLAALGREPPCRFDAIVMRGLDPSTIEWHRDVLG